MNPEAIDRLLSDAERVAETGVRLGRFADPGSFLTTIQDTRKAIGADTLTADNIIALQSKMNAAIKELAPLTLQQINDGIFSISDIIRTSSAKLLTPIYTLIVLILSISILVSTMLVTQLYDRATSILTLAKEVEISKANEMAIKLYDVITANETSIVLNSKPSIKEEKNSLNFVHDEFVRKYIELSREAVRNDVYARMSAEIQSDIDFYSQTPIFGILKNVSGTGVSVHTSDERPTYEQYIEKIPKIKQALDDYKNYNASYISTEFSKYNGSAEVLINSDVCRSIESTRPFDDPLQRSCAVLSYFVGLRQIMHAMNLPIDGTSSSIKANQIHELQNRISLFGHWVLPAAYGALGAVLFQMRRMLDPKEPGPSFMFFLYRIIIGAFSGIIVVWFWTPPPTALSQQNFATLSSFAVAFLFGFSTDIFFKFIDRIVNSLGDAVGKTPGGTVAGSQGDAVGKPQ